MKTKTPTSRASVRQPRPVSPPAEASDAKESPGSLAALAYREIRRMILKGEVPVGAALSRRELSERLRISLPPVTEAMQHLEVEGLLESRPRAGTRVRVPTREGIEGHAVVREALEGRSARLFAERATRAEREDLKKRGRQVDAFYASCEAGEVDREFLFAANTFHLGFHLRIAECGRVPALRDAIEKTQVLDFNFHYDNAVGRRALGSDFHSQLADALASGDADRAEQAMLEHIRGGLEEVLASLDKLPKDLGSWRKARGKAVPRAKV